jgi:hypothetical protein
MVCVEDRQFSKDYLDPDERSIATRSWTNLACQFPAGQQRAIPGLALDGARLAATPIHEFVELFVI